MHMHTDKANNYIAQDYRHLPMNLISFEAFFLILLRCFHLWLLCFFLLRSQKWGTLRPPPFYHGNHYIFKLLSLLQFTLFWNSVTVWWPWCIVSLLV